jgi:hypothetical protein
MMTIYLTPILFFNWNLEKDSNPTFSLLKNIVFHFVNISETTHKLKINSKIISVSHFNLPLNSYLKNIESKLMVLIIISTILQLRLYNTKLNLENLPIKPSALNWLNSSINLMVLLNFGIRIFLKKEDKNSTWKNKLKPSSSLLFYKF